MKTNESLDAVECKTNYVKEFVSRSGLNIKVVDEVSQFKGTTFWLDDLLSRSEFVIDATFDGFPALYLREKVPNQMSFCVRGLMVRGFTV